MSTSVCCFLVVVVSVTLHNIDNLKRKLQKIAIITHLKKKKEKDPSNVVIKH